MSAAVSARWVPVDERPVPPNEGCYDITDGKLVYTAYYQHEAGWGVIMRTEKIVAVPVADLGIVVTAWLKMKFGKSLPSLKKSPNQVMLSYQKRKPHVETIDK
jgi:hypothetical protein